MREEKKKREQRGERREKKRSKERRERERERERRDKTFCPCEPPRSVAALPFSLRPALRPEFEILLRRRHHPAGQPGVRGQILLAMRTCLQRCIKPRRKHAQCPGKW